NLLLLSVPAVLLMLLGAGLWVTCQRERSPITRENAERIQLGMTLADVEAIFGGPARIDPASENSFGWFLDFQHPPKDARIAVATRAWVGRHAKVEVAVDAGGRVVSVLVHRSARDREPFYDSIRRNFGP